MGYTVPKLNDLMSSNVVLYEVLGLCKDVLSINQEHQLLNLDGSPLLKHTSTCTDTRMNASI